MLQRSLSAILTAAFAAVSLLGHGGLHLLPGGHDCHGHLGQVESQAHSHAHGHDHGHCCSHTDPPAAADPSEAPAEPAPFEHDHDQCVVCQWHAQGQMSSTGVTLAGDSHCGLEATLPAAQITTSFRLSTLLTRGPPLQG